MRILCRVAIKAVEVKSTEARMETWSKRWGRIDLTKDVNGWKDREDEDKAKSRERDGRIGVCQDGYWVGGVFLAIVGCSSEIDRAEDAIFLVVWRSDIEKLNEGRLFGDIVWADGQILCGAEIEDEFGGPKKEAGAWKAGHGDKKVEILWGC